MVWNLYIFLIFYSESQTPSYRAFCNWVFEAPFVWIKSITVCLVVVRKASLLEGKVYGSASKPFVDYNCLSIKASSDSV